LHKIPKSYLNLYNLNLGAGKQSQEPADDGEDFGGVLSEGIMLQQQQTAMRAAAEQVEAKIEGSPQALRRSERLASKNPEEKMSPELSLTKKPTVEAPVLSDFQLLRQKFQLKRTQGQQGQMLQSGRSS
jgi:hypothetical protein